MSDEDSGTAEQPELTSIEVQPNAGKTPGIVTAGFVLSILGFCGITAIIGVILGFVGRKQAKANGAGVGLSTAAIVIGAAWIVLAVVGGIGSAISGGSSMSGSSNGTQVTNSESVPAQTESPKVEPSVAVEEPAPVVEANWYPKGYHEFSDGLAFKWANAKSDCYDCHYWSMYVVSRDGCPSSVYAEINILNKGVVITYTNDTLAGLNPMQKGLMKFESYDSSINSNSEGELKDISCY